MAGKGHQGGEERGEFRELTSGEAGAARWVFASVEGAVVAARACEEGGWIREVGEMVVGMFKVKEFVVGDVYGRTLFV